MNQEQTQQLWIRVAYATAIIRSVEEQLRSKVSAEKPKKPGFMFPLREDQAIALRQFIGNGKQIARFCDFCHNKMDYYNEDVKDFKHCETCNQYYDFCLECQRNLTVDKEANMILSTPKQEACPSCEWDREHSKEEEDVINFE